MKYYYIDIVQCVNTTTKMGRLLSDEMFKLDGIIIDEDDIQSLTDWINRQQDVFLQQNPRLKRLNVRIESRYYRDVKELVCQEAGARVLLKPIRGTWEDFI